MAILRRLLLVFAALAYGLMPFAAEAQPMAKSVAATSAPMAHQHDDMPVAHEAMQDVAIHGDLKDIFCLDHRQGRTGHPGTGCCQCVACLVLPVAFQGVDGKPMVGDAPLPSAVRPLSSRSHLPPVPPPRFL